MCQHWIVKARAKCDDCRSGSGVKEKTPAGPSGQGVRRIDLSSFGSGGAENVIALTKNRHWIAAMPATSAGIGAKSGPFEMALFLLYCCRYARGFPRQAVAAGPAETI